MHLTELPEGVTDEMLEEAGLSRYQAARSEQLIQDQLDGKWPLWLFFF